METCPKTLKAIISSHPNIQTSTTFFGLSTRLVYTPTDSRIQFIDRYYAPSYSGQLQQLFSLTDPHLSTQLKKTHPYAEAYNGKMLLECCVSKDKEFVAMRLSQYENIDYLPITEVRFLFGPLAKQAASFFQL